jgi:hypothetical protein
MKPFLPLLLLFLFCSSCSGVYNDPVLTIKNNTVFDSVGKLVDGKVVSHFSSGRVSGVAHYKEGLCVGEWFTYGFGGEVIQNGISYKDEKLANVLRNSCDVDYVIRDNWNEGEVDFVSVYVYMKKKTALIPDSIGNNIINGLTGSNREVLFYNNRDTLRTIRRW